MFIYLVAIVIIICTIFGLTYSQTSPQDISDGAARSSTIQLPVFSHSVPMIGYSRAGVDGDIGVPRRISGESLQTRADPFMEAAMRSPWDVEELEDEQLDQLEDERRQSEKRIFDEKLRDANQLGIAESLWQPTLKGADKAMKNIVNEKFASDGSKSAPQRVNTNTIFNMIQYETFKEAMAVLQKQQEQKEAAKAAEANERRGKTRENDGEAIADDEQNKENFPGARG